MYLLFAGILAGDCSAFGAAHLWYIFAYIEIIASLPILKMLCINDMKHNYVRWYCMTISGLYVVLVNVFYFINGVFGTKFSIYNYSLINRYMLYVLIGYECYAQFQDEGIINRIVIHLSLRKSMLFFLTVYVLGNIGVCLEELACLICFSQMPAMLYYSRYSALYVISTVSLFIFFMHIPLRNEKVNTVIRYIGDKTFYMYLVHYLFVQYIANNPCINIMEKICPLIKYILTVSAIFGISLACAVVIKIIQSAIYHVIDRIKDISAL